MVLFQFLILRHKIYQSPIKQEDFIEKIGVKEVVNLLDNGEIVEHIGDEILIEELIGRGYNITQDGII